MSDGGRYEIRVQGRLDTRWAEWFDGLAVTARSDGTTALTGAVDQAALHGALRTLADLGVPLLSVASCQPSSEETAMTTTVSAAPAPTPAAPRRRMTPTRKVALAGGIAYLVTFAASIPQLGLFADLVDDPAGYIGAPRDNTAVLVGSWLEIVTAAAGIATAVALYPVLRRVSRTSAIGFITTRVIEAALILVGVVSVLAVVSLQGDSTGEQAGALGVTGAALVAVRQATFLIGPGILPAFNALFLATALFRSRLVPRIIPAVGLVGAPLLLISATSTMFGGWDQVSGTGLLFALPIAAWEFSLGVWLTVKGFRREVDV